MMKTKINTKYFISPCSTPQSCLDAHPSHASPSHTSSPFSRTTNTYTAQNRDAQVGKMMLAVYSDQGINGGDLHVYYRFSGIKADSFY